MASKRSRPLTAQSPPPAVADTGAAGLAGAAGAGTDTPSVTGPGVLADVDTTTVPDEAAVERRRRFSAGLRGLRAGAGRLDERLLMVIGGVLAPVGVVVVVLGWRGAANTPYTFEQVPYLISGGVLGLALVFLGSFLYFAHWLTQLVKEHREQSRAVVDAIEHLRVEVSRLAAVRVADGEGVGGNGHRDEVVLVTTPRGTLAHLPDCVVVAGKPGVRELAEGEQLPPCKLCTPTGV